MKTNEITYYTIFNKTSGMYLEGHPLYGPYSEEEWVNEGMVIAHNEQGARVALAKIKQWAADTIKENDEDDYSSVYNDQIAEYIVKADFVIALITESTFTEIEEIV